MNVTLFIMLTIGIFFFLLMLAPKILYITTLIYHALMPKKKITGKSTSYKLSDLKESRKSY